MSNEAKEHWIREGLNTCQHKDLSFDDSAVPQTDSKSGFSTSSKDYLYVVTFLVPLSSETGFVIQRPKGKSSVFIAK